ncbi:MAG: SDR family oxidoreductase [Novosphingobium sp.]|nr:SDR family oxidoreductase [Novosphingobium sp.]
MSLIPDMKGRVAVVTGAASGLGRATALRLAEAGAQLCLVDIHEERLKETGSMISGSEVMLHVANLGDADACAPVIDAALARFGRLDALCNVAGIIRMTHFTDMRRQDYDLTIAVNLTAPLLLCQAAIPHLLETEGAIVNTVSTAAFIGEAYAAAYCASKAGLLAATKALAMEYVRKPIRINAVAPGGMMTNISEGMGFPENAEMDLIARYSGLRGLVEVEDVADIIALLASPQGRGFHGTCVTRDAGIAAG